MVAKLKLNTLLLIGAVLWGTLLILNGVSISITWIKPFSIVSGALGLLIVIYDKWGWKISVLHPWFVETPNIEGTWKCSIVPEKNEKIEQPDWISAYLLVRQTSSTIKVRLFTEQSGSDLVGGTIVKHDDGIHKLLGIYLNVPDLEYRNRGKSPIHHGGFIITIKGTRNYRLSGEYWTDRDTKGKIEFVGKLRKYVYDFVSAENEAYDPV